MNDTKRSSSGLVITTDSASNLTDDLLDRYGIEMIAFTAKVDGDDFICWERGRDYEAAAHTYYDAMRAGAAPGTSLINAQCFIDFFTPFVEGGHDLLYIGISSGLTGTVYSAAHAAAELRSRFPDRRIEVVDSVGASLGEGMLAIRAAELRNEGKDLDEIVKEVHEVIPHMNQLFTVDDLVYLYRGGRISRLVKLAGGLLGIKPLLKATDKGTIELYEKSRGRRRALDRIAEQFAGTFQPVLQRVGIAHADCEADALYLRDRIKSLTGVKDLLVRQYDLCSGSHVGPGALALFFTAEKR